MRAEIGPPVSRRNAALHGELGFGHAAKARDEGDYARARSLYQESLDLSGGAPTETRAIGLVNLGLVASSQGDSAAARSFFLESLVVVRKLGEGARKLGLTWTPNPYAALSRPPMAGNCWDRRADRAGRRSRRSRRPHSPHRLG